MIILPDRHITIPRFVVPIPKLEWMPPSQAQRRDEFGRPVEVRRWYVAALVNGREAWRGWFDDREDWDMFLLSAVSGNLQYDRYVQRLPSPWFDPEYLDGAEIVWAATRSLTGTSASNQTDTKPSDWNDASNFIDCIASGGSGAAGTASDTNVSGGSAGAWSRQTNVALGASPTYRLSAGGASVTGDTVGNAGADCWYNGSSLAASSVGAKGGLGGNRGTGGSNAAGVSGGAAASGIGSSKKSGGGSGTASSAFGSATGGGGAATSAGNGSASAAANNSNASNGGASGSGATGGTGSTFGSAGAGTAGTEYGSVGGGGGGGGAVIASGNAGQGGLYGAGGGSINTAGGGTSGQGRQAIVWQNWTPAKSRPVFQRRTRFFTRRH